jgi:hypothetical protein
MLLHEKETAELTKTETSTTGKQIGKLNPTTRSEKELPVHRKLILRMMGQKVCSSATDSSSLHNVTNFGGV